MKKIISICLTALLLVSVMVIPASAESQEVQQKVEQCGNIRIETILTVTDSLARASTKSAEKIKNYYSGDDLIATVKLKATFGYDGSEAWVNSTSVTKSTYSGWSYGKQSVKKNGNVATLSAELSKSFYEDILVEITMTCSPSGTIS